jgi:hypothetical protein
VKLNTDAFKALIPVIAILAITVMECFAMEHGHDGVILIGAITVVAGIAGYQLPNIIKKMKNNTKKEV